MEKASVEENQHYYKGFIEFKSKVEMLEETKKLLEDTVEEYLK